MRFKWQTAHSTAETFTTHCEYAILDTEKKNKTSGTQGMNMHDKWAKYSLFSPVTLGEES